MWRKISNALPAVALILMGLIESVFMDLTAVAIFAAWFWVQYGTRKVKISTKVVGIVNSWCDLNYYKTTVIKNCYFNKY